MILILRLEPGPSTFKTRNRHPLFWASFFDRRFMELIACPEQGAPAFRTAEVVHILTEGSSLS
jgi:hypothetical protein